MVWPTDSLTKTNFDAGTDSPASARAELEALYDHVKLISAEVADGATVWHSGNDGPTSTLNADLLDNEEGSFYRNASNLNAGTVPLAQIPTNLTGKNADQLDGQEGSFYQNAGNLNAGTVPLARLSGITGAQIASSTIAQGNLKTGQTAVSQTQTTAQHGVNVTLSGGEYSFFPESYYDYSSGGSSSDYVQTTILRQEEGVDIGYVLNVNFYWSDASSGVGTLYARSRYINASPPHKIDNVDYDEFIFVKLDSLGKVCGVSIASDPPWHHNGPTRVAPDYIDPLSGKKYIKEKIKRGTSNFSDYARELLERKGSLIEIDQSIKNADMSLIPHPFRTLMPGEKVLIIEPNSSGDYAGVCELFKSGEDVNKIIHDDYLRIDNTEIPTNGKPPAVTMHRIKWKNTR